MSDYLKCNYCKELLLHGDSVAKVLRSQIFYDDTNIPLLDCPQELWYHDKCLKKKFYPNTKGKKLISKTKGKVSNLEPYQLEIVRKLDTKFEEISKELDSEENAISFEDIEAIEGLLIFHTRILQVYNILFNKYIINDDFLSFKIQNILNYKLGGKMI